MNLKIAFILLLFTVIQSHSASISCKYFNLGGSGYNCELSISNPGGFNNFTGISGDHIFGFSDQDVVFVNATFGTSANIPSIICEKFRNLQRIRVSDIGVNRIDDSLRSCRNLRTLSLWLKNVTKIHQDALLMNSQLLQLGISGIRISRLPENFFRSQIFLRSLELSSTDIEELQPGLFAPLRNLVSLLIFRGRLTTIRSESFGLLPNLKTLWFGDNQINAIDEKFVNNTGVNELDLTGNVCFNDIIIDRAESRQEMRQKLGLCFENFKKQSEQHIST